MGRMLDVSLLVGTTEIAARVSLSRPQIVHTWRRRYSDFPAPVLTLDMGYLWYWPEVEAWLKRTGRGPGNKQRGGKPPSSLGPRL